MSTQYTAFCDIEWDNESRFLVSEFFTGLYETSPNEGTFKLAQSRGIDFGPIEAKLREMHRAHPDKHICFTSNVMMDCEDSFYFDFADEEIIPLVEEKYIYEHDETGVRHYDYCTSCERPVLQEEVRPGAFGCEFCKSENHITIHEVVE